MDIEQFPEDFYLPISLCIPLKMPDMMTREELTKLVQQLSSIPTESDDHFSFFSKDVIEKNLEVRGVNEEEERRAGEEIMPVDIETGTEESTMLDDLEKVTQASKSLPGPSPLTGTSPDRVSNTPQSPQSSSIDLSLPIPIATMAQFQLDLATRSPYSILLPNSSLPIDAMITPTAFSNPMSLTATTTTTTNQFPQASFNTLSTVPTTGSLYMHPLSATFATTHPTTHRTGFNNFPSSSHQDISCGAISNSLAGTSDSAEYIAAGQNFQSSSNDDLSRDWAQFEQWQDTELNGVEGRNPDLTMSDVFGVNVNFDWEGMDGNPSGDSVLNQFLSSLHTPMDRNPSSPSHTPMNLDHNSHCGTSHDNLGNLSLPSPMDLDYNQSVSYSSHTLMDVDHSSYRGSNQNQSGSFIPIPSIAPIAPSAPQTFAPSSLHPYSSYDGENCEPREQVASSITRLKKQNVYPTVNDIPVRRRGNRGVPCGSWKGYAILDKSDSSRELTCLIDLNEWVHLVGNVVKLYDDFNVYNGELSLEEYILYRKDPGNLAYTHKLSGEPVPRVPCSTIGPIANSSS